MPELLGLRGAEGGFWEPHEESLALAVVCWLAHNSVVFWEFGCGVGWASLMFCAACHYITGLVPGVEWSAGPSFMPSIYARPPLSVCH